MSLLSPVLWVVFGVLTVLAVLLTAVLAGKRGGWMKVAVVLMLVLTTLLSAATIGLKSNAKMAWVKDTGEAWGLLMETADGPGNKDKDATPQAAPEAPKVDPNAPLTAQTKLPETVAGHPGDPQWTPQLTQQANGEWIGQFTGPNSKMDTEVSVWLPPGYSTDSATVYDVTVFLHGFPGSNRGVVDSFNLNGQIAPMMAAGQIRPTIFVVADTSKGGAEPDCIDFEGRPLTETMNTRDLVSMVRSLYPNVSDERGGWTLSGISAGAYCAPVLEMRHQDVFWGALSLGGYDDAQFGTLLNLPADQRLTYNISSLLADKERHPANIYIAGTTGDPDSVTLAQAVEPEIREGDNIKIQLDQGGGHSWQTWASQLPGALKWWTDSTGGVKVPITDSPQSGGADEPDEVEAEPTGPVVDFLKLEEGPFSMRGAGSLALVALLAALGLCVTVGAGPSLRAHGVGGALLFLVRVVAVVLTALCLTMVFVLIMNNGEGFFTSWWDMWQNRSMLS